SDQTDAGLARSHSPRRAHLHARRQHAALGRTPPRARAPGHQRTGPAVRRWRVPIPAAEPHLAAQQQRATRSVEPRSRTAASGARPTPLLWLRSVARERDSRVRGSRRRGARGARSESTRLARGFERARQRSHEPFLGSVAAAARFDEEPIFAEFSGQNASTYG